MIENNEFIEHCEVHTNMYGTAVKELERISNENKIPIFEIDVQGAEKVFRRKLGCNFLFILPCENLEETEDYLRERLTGRGTETQEQIDIRVHNSQEEVIFCISVFVTFF